LGPEANVRFGLLPTEFRGWEPLCQYLAGILGRGLLRSPRPQEAEWVGVFALASDPLPFMVILGKYILIGITGNQRIAIHLSEEASHYSIQPRSHILQLADYTLAGGTVRGFPERVRVVEVKRGQKKTVVMFYYGRIRDLDWDPARVTWSDSTPFMEYSTQKGQELLRNRTTPPNLAQKSWNLILPP
jgi:hypothetical protein